MSVKFAPPGPVQTRNHFSAINLRGLKSEVDRAVTALAAADSAGREEGLPETRASGLGASTRRPPG